MQIPAQHPGAVELVVVAVVEVPRQPLRELHAVQADPAALIGQVPDLDDVSWSELRRRLVAHPAILEAEWVAGLPVTIRHWSRLITREEIAGLLRLKALPHDPAK